MESKEHRIVVLGSASGDFFLKVGRIPQVGETIDAHGFEKALGGKGANQAVTVGKLGAPIEMLAQLGNDETGRKYLEFFKESNVGTSEVKLLDGKDSGQAYILSLKDGNNSIIIVGGTNSDYDPNMTELDPKWADTIRKSKILLLQREIPEYVNIIAARIAKEAGTMVILDVGGREEPLSKELIQYLDIISPNETELERVVHKKGLESEADIQREVEIFIRTNPHVKVLLKRGEHGSSIFYLSDNKESIVHLSRPAFSFADHPDLKLVDTTGAGDCYTGAFAVKMLEGHDFETALDFSNKVGFLCITKFGAGPSVPSLADVERVFGK